MENLHATQQLRDDHKRFRGLFNQFLAVGQRSLSPEFKESVAAQILMELDVHSRLEEEIFYPALIAVMDVGKQGLINEALGDHAAILDIMFELQKRSALERGFTARMIDLQEMVVLHTEKEERDLFPEAEKLLAKELDELGFRMADRRQQLMALPQYARARPEFTQDPRGGEQMRKHSRGA